MKIDFNPVGVKLNIENPSIERDAFYRLCFITESNIAPRTLKVTRLQDLLDNGYSRLDLVYNFCVGVFSQQGIDTVYIRAKRSSESYVEAYNSDDNSMYYFVVLQTKDLTEIEKFNNHLVSSDEMKLQFFSQNIGSKTLQSPKLVNYYQDYTRPEGGVSSDDRDFYLNSAYEGLVTQIKLSLPDYLLSGLGDIAIDYGIYNMSGKKQIWEIDKAERRIRYAPEVLQQGWVGSREESTIVGSDITVVAYRGSVGSSKKSTVLNPKVEIETLSGELLKGLGKEVLDYAIPLIDPEATDWVLDSANNRVIYYEDEYVNEKGYKVEGSNTYFPTADAACADLLMRFGFDGTYKVIPPSNNVFGCSISRSGYSDQYRSGEYNQGDLVGQKEKYISIPTVAAQVIANAESGHAESQTFLKSIPLFAYLLTGSGTEAVDKAVLDIDPEATDWELDPTNNAVKYKDPNSGSDDGGSPWDAPDCDVGSQSWVVDGIRYKKYQDAGQAFCIANGADIFSGYSGDVNNGSSLSVSCQTYGVAGDTASGNIFRLCDDVDIPVPEPDTDRYKSIPIDVVAAKVISNAETGHTPSQEALKLSTVERVNIGEYDEALEAASSTIETWKYLPIFDVAVQVKRNSIAGHAESIEAVNNSLPFVIPDNDTPWAYVPEETSVTGSTTTIKAKRTFENQKLKSSISVDASASKVGESLINGGGSDALAYAMVELADGATDWVLDPANNQVKYTQSTGGGSGGSWIPQCQPEYGYLTLYDRDNVYSSGQAACDAAAPKLAMGALTFKSPNQCLVSDGRVMAYASYDKNPKYDASCVEPEPEPVPEEKYIPIDTVAAKIITNAETGHTPSQEAVKATALEGFTAGEYNADLDSAAVIDN